MNRLQRVAAAGRPFSGLIDETHRRSHVCQIEVEEFLGNNGKVGIISIRGRYSC